MTRKTGEVAVCNREETTNNGNGMMNNNAGMPTDNMGMPNDNVGMPNNNVEQHGYDNIRATKDNSGMM